MTEPATTHTCFFFGGPHHNMTMQRTGKPTSGYGTLSPALHYSSERIGPGQVTWGYYRHEFTIGYGPDGPIPAVSEVPVAFYVWHGDKT